MLDAMDNPNNGSSRLPFDKSSPTNISTIFIHHGREGFTNYIYNDMDDIMILGYTHQNNGASMAMKYFQQLNISKYCLLETEQELREAWPNIACIELDYWKFIKRQETAKEVFVNLKEELGKFRDTLEEIDKRESVHLKYIQ